MECEIIWNKLDAEGWQARFDTLPFATVPQSPPYAQAAAACYGQRSRRGLILIDGQDAGMVQIQEAGLFRDFIHAVILDRGPLWFAGYGTPEQQRAFFTAFNSAFPRRIGRRRRIIPELPDNTENRALLAGLGYRRLARPGYQTSVLDLAPALETMRASLDKKWRNALSKAERSDIDIEWDTGGAALSAMLAGYARDRREKAYRGASVPLLRILAAEQGLIGTARLDKRAIASILILCHGRSATYQAGWTTDAGRQNAAHHLLLWDGLARLKARGFTQFDLGGVNEESARHVKKFKDGLGGTARTLVGHYM